MDFLSLLVRSTAFLLTVLFTTTLSGTIVHVEAGKHRGKLAGSDKYRAFWVLFGAFVIEAVLLAILFGFAETALDMLLYSYLLLIPFIVAEAFFAFFLWFCGAFGGFEIGKHWKFLVACQIISVVNLLVYVAYLQLKLA